METWIQFTLLMLTLITLAVRNEHRITMLEGALKVEQVKRDALRDRVDKLEERKT